MSKEENIKTDKQIDKEIENQADLEQEKVDSDLESKESEMNEDEKNENEENFKELYEQKIKEIEELNNNFLRLKADFNNYKKRVQKEKEAIYAYAAEEVITEILGVMDNFERALNAVDDKEKDSSLHQGVEMIYNQLLGALKKAGLQEIEALNEKFDPNLHHGVAQEESEDHDEDTILEVFQKGYKLKEKVIRPSMVKISK